MANYTYMFTNPGQVKQYLANKAFSNSRSGGNTVLDGITPQELDKFICDAESQVQLDLSRQFTIPLVAANGQPFDTTPQQTQLIISRMATWQSCIIILSVYFGRSEGVRGKSYLEDCEREYEKLSIQVTGINSHGQYIQPPLQDLQLNSHASYRSEAGAPAPLSVRIGLSSRDNSAVTRRKLTNLNKSIWRGRGRFPL